jgi:hypothetical protein
MVLSSERLECIRELVVEVIRRLTSGKPISSVWWSRMMHILNLVAGDPSGKFAIPRLSASCRKAVKARLARCQRSSALLQKRLTGSSDKSFIKVFTIVLREMDSASRSAVNSGYSDVSAAFNSGLMISDGDTTLK